jgi:hypothetical protein
MQACSSMEGTPRTTGGTDVLSRVCALPWYQWRAPQPGANQAKSTAARQKAKTRGVQLKFVRSTWYATGNTNATCKGQSSV